MSKKNIVVIADRPDWSFDRIAHQITRYVDSTHIAYYSDGSWKQAPLTRCVVCLWYGRASDVFDRYIDAIKIVCVYDMKHWKANDTWLKRAIERSNIVMYACDDIRLALLDHFAQAKWLHLESKLRPCYDGVDLDHFVPQRPRESEATDGRLRIGWSGNAAMHGELKGFDLIRSACDENREWLTLCVADPSVDGCRRTYTQMPDFYGSIDVYVCASSSEGTPNPILEACASERPFVSTKVGIVAMLVAQAHEPIGIVLDKRSTQCIVSALRRLYDAGPERRAKMGRAGRRTLVENAWAWKHRALQFY